jgi:UDP-N-acetylmuramate dehydrogenase
MDIKENISLAKHTTFKIGGPAKYFCIVRDKGDLFKAIRKARELKTPFFILGGGSNTLALDKGYKGLLIKVHNTKLVIDKSEIYAEAGVKLEDIVRLTANESLSGLEWAAGIPGTIGGAVYGNAQAFGAGMTDIIKNVEVLDAKSLKIKNLSRKQCLFSVKKSIFKKNKNLIILSAILKLRKENKKEVQERIREHLDYRKKNHPWKFPSAGSVFVNKIGGSPSSRLIEECGLKGTKIGGAEISEKHAGFIINIGKAKAEDVLKLIKIIKQKVKSKFGIDLEPEIQIIK